MAGAGAFWHSPGTQVAGGFIPGVGEAMDLEVLIAGDASGADKILAALSLAVSAATVGFAPNFGGALRSANDALSLADDAVDQGRRLTGYTGGGVRVASGAGRILPASVVRMISKGETVDDLVEEMVRLTFESGGVEHAIISLKDGSRMIVRGGPGGIDFGDLPLRRVLLHTHPSPTGPSQVDFDMLDALNQRHSYIYELFGGGLTRFNRK